MKTIQQKIDTKRRAFKEFDSLPASEQRKLTDQGLNPHEAPAIRAAKQARVHAGIERRIAKLPKEEREKLIELGLYQRNENTITRRLTGSMIAKNF